MVGWKGEMGMSDAGTVLVDRDGSLYICDTIQFVTRIRKEYEYKEIRSFPFSKYDKVFDKFAFRVGYKSGSRVKVDYDEFYEAKESWESLTGEKYIGDAE
jgi:hypothetical protein